MNSSPKRFEVLDSWRGICACLIVVYHLRCLSPLDGSAFKRNSYLFVDFFFVLSGFVISLNYEARISTWQSVRTFMLLRFGRLWPLHAFMIITFIATGGALWMIAWARASGTTPEFKTYPLHIIVSNLLLFPHLLASSTESLDSINPPAWSICCEFYTYLLFAVACATKTLRTHGLILLVIVAPVFIHFWFREDQMLNFSIIRCVFGFGIGCLCARGLERVRMGARRFSGQETWCECGVLGLVIGYVCIAGVGPLSVFAPYVFAVAVLVFALELGAVSRLLRRGLFLKLGMLSYSIYLTHYYLITWVLPQLEKTVLRHHVSFLREGDGSTTVVLGANPIEGTLAYFMVIVACVAGSWITYHLVEKPGRNLSRKWAGSLI